MYKYSELRPQVFTEEGQVMFLKVRDNAHGLLTLAGAARADKILSPVSGDSWLMLACLDRLVELKEIREIPQENSLGQHRIFVSIKD